MKKDGKQRLFEMMGKVDKSFKNKLNENIYVDDNAPQLLEYIIEYLPKVTNIAIKDPNSSSRWDGFFMRDVNFKNTDYDNAYFYYETSGVGHDEEGQRAFSEPKSGVIAVPFSVMVDIDNSYADTNGSTLIINSDLQDEIKAEAGGSGLGENVSEQDDINPNNDFNKKMEYIIDSELMHGHDGPVDDFVIISRAIELALKNTYTNELDELYSNALYEALERIKKRGGHIPTGERVV